MGAGLERQRGALAPAHAQRRQPPLEPAAAVSLFRRQSAAVIGIAGSVGAFGGFLIQLAFRQASLSTVEQMAKPRR